MSLQKLAKTIKRLIVKALLFNQLLYLLIIYSEKQITLPHLIDMFVYVCVCVGGIPQDIRRYQLYFT